MSMKKSANLAITVILGIFLSVIAAVPVYNDVESEIKQAAQVLFGSSASQKEIVRALTHLIDCAIALSVKSEYAAEIKEQLNIAKNQFETKSLFNDKGRQKLAFAFRMLTNGQKYQPPEELDDFITPEQAMEKARVYAGKLVEQALDDYRNGDHLQSAKSLVELVLMVVTPISAADSGARRPLYLSEISPASGLPL